jgi:hypothetical protein
MTLSEKIVIRLKRQPNRAAIDRLREAYRHLSTLSQPMGIGTVEAQQEEEGERDSSLVRTRIDAPAGARGHD